MGYIKHNAVIAVTVEGYGPDVEQFRAGLPEEWKPLVVGPIPGVVNGYVSYAFLPDGSKEGWPPSDDGDKYRADFMALFDDAVDVQFGGDDDLTHVTTSGDAADNAEEVRKVRAEAWDEGAAVGADVRLDAIALNPMHRNPYREESHE